MAEQNPSPNRQYAQNLALAAVAGQAGCASLVIIMVALVVGLWIDGQLGWRGPFTIGLLICSVPVSLLVMLKIALGAINQIIPQPRDPQPTSEPEKEDVDL